jgi:hypothetical protein
VEVIGIFLTNYRWRFELTIQNLRIKAKKPGFLTLIEGFGQIFGLKNSVSSYPCVEDYLLGCGFENFLGVSLDCFN